MRYLSENEARKDLEKDIIFTKLSFSEKEKQQIIDARMWRVNSSAVWTEDDNINAGIKFNEVISEEKTLISCALHWNQSIEKTRKDFSKMYESVI